MRGNGQTAVEGVRYPLAKRGLPSGRPSAIGAPAAPPGPTSPAPPFLLPPFHTKFFEVARQCRQDVCTINSLDNSSLIDY